MKHTKGEGRIERGKGTLRDFFFFPVSPPLFFHTSIPLCTNRQKTKKNKQTKNINKKKRAEWCGAKGCGVTEGRVLWMEKGEEVKEKK